jgi:hypothetical protein
MVDPDSASFICGPLNNHRLETGDDDMAQFGFYMAGVGVAGGGRAGLLLAWNPNDRGPGAADEIDITDIGLYSWIGSLPIVSPAVFKMRSRSPMVIPADDCPPSLDGGGERDFVVRFGVKPGGSTASLIGDGWLEIFVGSTRVYGISAPTTTVKMELAEGSMNLGLTEYSMQDRVILSGLEDPLEGWDRLLSGSTPAKDIWSDLMTPDRTLSWSPA